jgi:hypothetical protein
MGVVKGVVVIVIVAGGLALRERTVLKQIGREGEGQPTKKYEKAAVTHTFDRKTSSGAR